MKKNVNVKCTYTRRHVERDFNLCSAFAPATTVTLKDKQVIGHREVGSDWEEMMTKGF